VENASGMKQGGLGGEEQSRFFFRKGGSGKESCLETSRVCSRNCMLAVLAGWRATSEYRLPYRWGGLDWSSRRLSSR